MNEFKSYPTIIGPIELGAELGRAYLRIGIKSDTTNWIKIAFSSEHIKDKLLNYSLLRSSTIFDTFDTNITKERAKIVLKWILKLDVSLKRQYLKNSIVTINTPVKSPLPLPSLNENTAPQVYWDLRQPVGFLIRPLLLKPSDFDKLYPFQLQGVKWLYGKRGAILADDMGLGKTIQAIHALRILFNIGNVRNVILICPKSLIPNWENELRAWSPELSRVRVNVKNKDKERVWKYLLKRIHITITNYEHLREPPSILRKDGVDIIIADEAQKIKRSSSLITIGIKKIPVKYFWALTGTPLERDAEDFLTILSVIEPSRFTLSDKSMPKSLIRHRAKPFVLRRKKYDVLMELPSVIETKEVIELLPRQRISYDNAIKKHLARHDRNDSVLYLLNKLHSICDYDHSSNQSSKLCRIEELIDKIDENDEKVVTFSYTLTPLYRLKNLLLKSISINKILLIEGKMSTKEREDVLQKFRGYRGSAVLLASTKVAGVGLTLTEANHVIFINEWWNPSANSQARDRVVRIGQKRITQVIKFICKNTVEESLQEILIQKNINFQDIVDSLSKTNLPDTNSSLLLREILDTVLRKEP